MPRRLSEIAALRSAHHVIFMFTSLVQMVDPAGLARAMEWIEAVIEEEIERDVRVTEQKTNGK